MNLTTPVNKIAAISNTIQNQTVTGKKETGSVFEDIYQSAIGMLEETNRYTHQAEEAQMSFALGLNDNFLDLIVAQNKANMSLQYTVAVRNGILDAYKELMQMQF